MWGFSNQWNSILKSDRQGKKKKTHGRYSLHLHFTDEEETVVEIRPFVPHHTHSKQQTEHTGIDLPVSDHCSTAPGCLPHKELTAYLRGLNGQQGGASEKKRSLPANKY